MQTRNIENGQNEPEFPDKYGVEERHEFYKTISGLNNWAGGLGNYFSFSRFSILVNLMHVLFSIRHRFGAYRL